jgi:hypothetical protein
MFTAVITLNIKKHCTSPARMHGNVWGTKMRRVSSGFLYSVFSVFKIHCRVPVQKERTWLLNPERWMISWLMRWNACLVGTVNRRMGWQIGWGSDSLECLTDLVRGVEWLVYDMWYEMLSSLVEWKSERIDWLTDWFVKGQSVWSAWFLWWVIRLIGRWRMERNGWLAGYIDW